MNFKYIFLFPQYVLYYNYKLHAVTFLYLTLVTMDLLAACQYFPVLDILEDSKSYANH